MPTTHCPRPHYVCFLGLLVALQLFLAAPGLAQPATPTLLHQPWDKQLKRYVNTQGLVNYRAWQKDTVGLAAYLGQLSAHLPESTAPADEQLAYWLNAYNAATVLRVLRAYPIRSIRELGGIVPRVNTVWDQRFLVLGGKRYSLNDIEHQIIRKRFTEPRIHMALVCAARSCPPLRQEAYTAPRLQAQLADQTSTFLRDASKNNLRRNPVQVSAIFDWYAADFTRDNSSLRQFLARYAPAPIPDGVPIRFMPYDWTLNAQ